MSIDADLRAGLIDEAGVKEKRRDIENESQLFDSFDGAMKFIKGDAIARIIIIVVNLIGGIAVGMAQLGMNISAALHTYAFLTIGDGLVVQIPALLISISAVLIVTHVGGNDKNPDANIFAELFTNDFTMLITAIIVCAIEFFTRLSNSYLLIFGRIDARLVMISYVQKTQG